MHRSLLAIVAVLLTFLAGCNEQTPAGGVPGPVPDAPPALPTESQAGWQVVSSAWNASCGVDDEGFVRCWGAPYGKLAAGPPSGRFVDVALGGYHACGVTTTGEVTCWGCESDFPGPCLPPPSLAEPSSLVVDGISCALASDGELHCWHRHPDASPRLPEGRFATVAVEDNSGCVLDAAGEASCWGKDSSTSLPEGTWAAIALGINHGCGIERASAELVCWGWRNPGTEPYPPPPSGRFVSVDAYERRTCAIRETGEVVCWGGTCGPGPDPAGRFVDVSVGFCHVCGIDDARQMQCWGQDELGQHDIPELL